MDASIINRHSFYFRLGILQNTRNHRPSILRILVTKFLLVVAVLLLGPCDHLQCSSKPEDGGCSSNDEETMQEISKAAFVISPRPVLYSQNGFIVRIVKLNQAMLSKK